MRADRLLAMLLLLQNRGRLTAEQLSEELEVSVRTVFRDVEALGIAGIPVYTVRGRDGGIELYDGWSTQLPGWSGDEAESLFLIGMPGPASELGLGDALARVELKLIEAMPAALRLRAEELRNRFHHDPAAWFQPLRTPSLAVLTKAVWQSRVVEIETTSTPAAVDVEPLALALKAGEWHLVANRAGPIAVIAVAEITAARLRRRRFTRPDDFDLASEWEAWVASEEQRRRPDLAPETTSTGRG